MLAVIIPAYNRPECLREALNSLVMQTKKNFLTIVIDDCGEVDLAEVCSEFVDKLNIKCFRKKINEGPGRARQTGLDICYNSRAKIDYVMFLDSDDMLMPNAIKKLSYEITRNHDDIIISTISVESKTNADFLIAPQRSARVWLHGKIFNTDFLKKNNIEFEKNLRGNEDVNFMIKCMALTKKVKYVEDALYLWRDEQTSITREHGSARDGVLGLDYIRAVCTAIIFLYKKGIDVSRHVIYGFYCYDYYQIALARGNEITQDVEDILKELWSIPLITKEMEKIKAWDELSKHIHQFKVIDKKVYFFNETFTEWLNKYGVDWTKLWLK